MTALPTPPTTADDALAWVGEHLADLTLEGAANEPLRASKSFRGGQTAADAALAAFDVTGYARRRNEVLPASRRGASRLSPYIRHGLIQLRTAWDHVADGPSEDRSKFRDELLWQEYARHWYARLGTATRTGVRREVPLIAPESGDDPWDRTMACLDATVGELHDDGWLVNQTRMWLASHWTVRERWHWRAGEDEFFRHLLDGSRAANRLGWQWTTGVGSSKPYAFSKWQVDKRAAGLCAGCELRSNCPIDDWPDDPEYQQSVSSPSATDSSTPWADAPVDWQADAPVDAVWLTAESLGDDDPALAAHPELPAVFVFDEPLLASLQLSSKRLVFLAETLGDLATRRAVEVHRGRPADVLADRDVAVTHAPVPGFARIAAVVQPTDVSPWPWLAAPHRGSVSSFSAWRKRIRVG